MFNKLMVITSKIMYYYSLLQFEMGQLKKMMISSEFSSDEEKYFQILTIFCDLNETQNMQE